MLGLGLFGRNADTESPPSDPETYLTDDAGLLLIDGQGNALIEG